MLNHLCTVKACLMTVEGADQEAASNLVIQPLNKNKAEGAAISLEEQPLTAEYKPPHNKNQS